MRHTRSDLPFLAAFSVIVAVAGCARGPSGALVPPWRATQPCFKGVELYSWQDSGDGWHFSLLLGTNRTKSAEEVLDPACRIDSVEKLKDRLSLLARGEHVCWSGAPGRDLPVPAGIRFGMPGPDVVQGLSKHCESLGIHLFTQPA